MIQLKIPFAEKDRAKDLARENGTPIRWEPDDKFWYYPGDTLPDCLREFASEYSEIETSPQREGNTGGNTKPVPSLPKGPRVLAVDYTYMPFAKAAGAKWNPNLKVCTFEGKTLPIELTGFEPKAYSWEAWAQEELTGERLALPKKGNLTPREDQELAIKEILTCYKQKAPGFLLADSVGLGKTISAWESILRIEPKKEKRVLILCPLAVIAAWRDTIEKMGDGGNRILLLNYDRLKKIYELAEGAKAKSLKGVARKGKPLEFDVVILDESHKLRNIQSARSKLAIGLYKDARFLLWMSATAGQNILELAYLAPLLASRTGSKVTAITKDFEDWCKSQGIGLERGAYGKWTQDADPSTNQKIHELLFTKIGGVLGGIRRTPQDLKGWPEIQRIGIPIELSPQQRGLYELAWDEFLQAVQTGKATLKPGQNPVSSPQGMAGLMRLRQKASILKVDETVEVAQELLENGLQVAISCQFLDPVEKIIEALEKAKVPTTRFTGKENPTQKEENRVSYQKGNHKVIVFTVEEGISLHQGEYNNVPRAQINHDPRWSGIAAEQIDGRSHRNGMFAPVHWLYLKDTVEERIITRLLERMTSMGEINGDETESLEILRKELIS